MFKTMIATGTANMIWVAYVTAYSHCAAYLPGATEIGECIMWGLG